MVYSLAGSSELFSILGYMTSNVLHLNFSTLHSSSLWRTDTIVFVELNKPLSQISPPPPWNVFEIIKPRRGFIEDLGRRAVLLQEYVHTGGGRPVGSI